MSETSSKLPPRTIWDNKALLMEWASKHKNYTSDKAQSWARGFMHAGSKRK